MAGDACVSLARAAHRTLRADEFGAGRADARRQVRRLRCRRSSRCRARGRRPSPRRKPKAVLTISRMRASFPRTFASSPEHPASRKFRVSPSSTCIRSGCRPMRSSGETSSCTRPKGRPARRRSMALAQAKNPTKRGVTVWVETDGTVYWSTAENVIPTHGDGANRNDNKYIDNSKTYRSVIKTNSIGVEFVGNYPDVAKPATREQRQAWLILVRFLQERYDIPAENIYAHNWIDYQRSPLLRGLRAGDACAQARLRAREASEQQRVANSDRRTARGEFEELCAVHHSLVTRVMNRELNGSRGRARPVFRRARFNRVLGVGARAFRSRRNAGLRLRATPSRRTRGAATRA